MDVAICNAARLPGLGECRFRSGCAAEFTSAADCLFGIRLLMSVPVSSWTWVLSRMPAAIGSGCLGLISCCASPKLQLQRSSVRFTTMTHPSGQPLDGAPDPTDETQLEAQLEDIVGGVGGNGGLGGNAGDGHETSLRRWAAQGGNGGNGGSGGVGGNGG